jgi:ATP-dependent DNA helicase RecG
MLLKKLKDLILEQEGFRLEFKESYSPKIANDIVAMSNSKGGKILIGVTDQGNIKGTDFNNKLKSEIIDLARNCEPPINVTVQYFHKIICIEIPESTQKPHSCSAGFYKRYDSVSQKLKQSEIALMFQEGRKTAFDEQNVNAFKMSDLSIQKINIYSAECNLSLKINKLNSTHFLQTLGVLKNKKINSTGVLFFSKNTLKYFPQSKISMIAFKDVAGTEIFDRNEVQDDLFTQFNQALFFLEKHLNKSSQIVGRNRIDRLEIPIEILRESIANAIIHRSYEITGTEIQIRVFPDKVQITNPGALVEGMTLEKMSQLSMRRNELIADLFFRMHKAEKAGTGIRRIRAEVEKSGIQNPSYESSGAFFMTVFQREKTTRKTTPKTTPKATRKNQQNTIDDVLQLILKNPTISRDKIGEILGITVDGVKYHLRKLEKDKIIVRDGLNRYGKWKILRRKI